MSSIYRSNNTQRSNAPQTKMKASALALMCLGEEAVAWFDLVSVVMVECIETTLE